MRYRLLGLIAASFSLVACGPSGGQAEPADSGQAEPTPNSQAALIQLAIDPAVVPLAAGDTRILRAMGTFDDGEPPSDLSPQVAWTSSDPAVAALSTEPGDEGRIRALARGEATITATHPKTGRTATATVTVTSPLLRSFSITPALSGVPKGRSWSLSAIGAYGDGTTAAVTERVTFTSSNPAVLAVTPQGQATAVYQGQAVITAQHTTAGSVSLAVEVFDANLLSLVVSAPVKTLESEATAQLAARGTFTDGTVRDITPWAVWTSSDPDSVSVSAAGLARGEGAEQTATLTATFGTQSSSVQIAQICSLNPGPLFSAGSGTRADPYRICSFAELQRAGANVAAHYRLRKDLDVTGFPGFEGFTGTFDGNHRTLSNYSGVNAFFRFPGSTFAVTNLRMKDPVITGGGAGAGTLVDNLTGGTVSNCHAINPTVTGEGGIGGLVGQQTAGTINGSSVQGGVVRGQVNVGGLVGQSFRVSNSFSSARVEYLNSGGPLSLGIGGLVGVARGTLSNSYSTGAVVAPAGVSYGGLAGRILDASDVTVTSSYWDTQASGISTSPIGIGKTTVQMGQQSTFTGWDFSTIWKLDVGDTYPTLR